MLWSKSSSDACSVKRVLWDKFQDGVPQRAIRDCAVPFLFYGTLCLSALATRKDPQPPKSHKTFDDCQAVAMTMDELSPASQGQLQGPCPRLSRASSLWLSFCFTRSIFNCGHQGARQSKRRWSVFSLSLAINLVSCCWSVPEN